jgi:predicted dehydrogenase
MRVGFVWITRTVLGMVNSAAIAVPSSASDQLRGAMMQGFSPPRTGVLLNAPMPDAPLCYCPPSPRKKDFRIGILGSGFIVNDCHLASYRRAGFNPVAISSRSRENAARVANRHGIASVYSSYEELLDDPTIEVLDLAVPPQYQPQLIYGACARGTVKGILAQKPLALSYRDAVETVTRCEQAGIELSVNQNMRYDPCIHTVKRLADAGNFGTPVFATIDMRGVPHWQPWQAETGSASLWIMSIHHLDCMRFWFGDPETVFCSARPDPRTGFPHSDGICTTILEYACGLHCVVIDDVWTGPVKEGCPGDLRIEWRMEGLDGLAMGDVGWCKDPYTSPSSMRYARKGDTAFHHFRPAQSWFPDAFAGTMAQLLVALETGGTPEVSGHDNLHTIALVEAAAISARQHRVVCPKEISSGNAS